MGKIIDFLLTENWEEYKRVQLYKKLGKTLEPEQPKQMGVVESMANLANVVIAQKRQKRNGKNKGNSITYINGKGKIVSVPINKQKKNQRVYHLTKKELDIIVKNAIKKRK